MKSCIPKLFASLSSKEKEFFWLHVQAFGRMAVIFLVIFLVLWLFGKFNIKAMLLIIGFLFLGLLGTIPQWRTFSLLLRWLRVRAYMKKKRRRSQS